MAVTQVIHIRHAQHYRDLVRIGRPTKWGNPFKIGVDGNRQEVIEKYRLHLVAHPEIIRAARQELKGKTLVCYCKPLACHGDLLAAAADGRLCERCARPTFGRLCALCKNERAV